VDARAVESNVLLSQGAGSRGNEAPPMDKEGDGQEGKDADPAKLFPTFEEPGDLAARRAAFEQGQMPAPEGQTQGSDVQIHRRKARPSSRVGDGDRGGNDGHDESRGGDRAGSQISAKPSVLKGPQHSGQTITSMPVSLCRSALQSGGAGVPDWRCSSRFVTTRSD